MQQDNPFSAMPTGVTAIDELHQSFAETMRLAAEADDPEFAGQYGTFVKAAERTFSIEEYWMEEIDCPLLHSHREQHARVLGALHNVHGRVMGGDIALGREVVGKLLPQWFAFHVATMDVALAVMLASEQTPVTAPACRDEAAYID